MSCHDPHFAQARSPILRGPSSVEYCEDCHFERPVLGASHPLRGMSATINADLTTEDGGTLPNYARLFMETTNRTGGAGGGEMICRTCHGGEFGTGVIHGGMDRFMLADYIKFGEICVNCHGYDSRTIPGTGYSQARLDSLRVGSADVKSANPSYYYREGPSPTFTPGLEPVTAAGLVQRVGSHYVGQITNRRPFTDDADYGWLGSSDTSLDHLGEIENSTNVTKWLDTFWFAPYASGQRRIWDTGIDGVGTNQYSIIGYLNESASAPVVICLSCHTPHGAASGNAGNGVVDDTAEATDWDGELLLARNKGSYICYVCHLPEATHPVNDPGIVHGGKLGAPAQNFHKTYASTDPRYSAKNPNNRHDWVTRTDTTINIYDTADPKKVVRMWESIYVYNKPANYPTEGGVMKVFCESCHSAHSANSRWGSYILEGDTTVAPNNDTTLIPWSSTALTGDVGKHNKRPMQDHSNPDTTKAVNDRPTCEMCHPQGTE
jgi:mono/diheme cytochrome c family protein